MKALEEAGVKWSKITYAPFITWIQMHACYSVVCLQTFLIMDCLLFANLGNIMP